MNADEYQRVRMLFDALATLSSDDRGTQLGEACVTPAVRAEVLRLLAASDRVSEETTRRAMTFAETGSDRWIGRQIDGFVIERELGRGGMGRVYLARRVDSDTQQHVAIKLDLRANVQDDRFRLERRVLATLTHPDIATLLDLGETVDGTPYFVMEYVDGVSIAQYVRNQALDIATRLRLFLRVCAAIAYAHRNLVVHRDIKASNILVDADGHPKLLDFGIAKPLDLAVGAHEAFATATRQRVFSFCNAAPEQLRGGPITVACDVYGLGTLLYELLTGLPLFDLEGTTPGEAERLILERDPPPPSQRRNQDGSAPGPIDADLDAVVLRCLRKSPEQRYISVDALSEDITRYLSGYPVAARAGTTLYRLRRFLQRHSRAVAASALMVSIASAAGGAVWVQRQEARQQETRADRMTDLILQTLDVASPVDTSGVENNARDVFNRLAQGTLDDPTIDESTRARLLAAIAGVQLRLTLIAPALEVYSRIDYERLSPRERDAAMRGHAQALNTAGKFDQAARLVEQGSKAMPGEQWAYLEALVLFGRGRYDDSAQAIHRYRAMIAPESLPVRWRDLLANDHLMLGHMREAYAEYSSLVPDLRAMKPPPTNLLLSALNGLAVAGTNIDKIDEAHSAANEAGKLTEAAYGRNSVRYGVALNAMADVAMAQKDYAGAQTMLTDMLAIRRNALGDKHPGVAQAYFKLGLAHIRQAQPDLAEASLTKAVEIADVAMDEQSTIRQAYRDQLALHLALRGDLVRAKTTLGPLMALAQTHPNLTAHDEYAIALLLGALCDYASERTPANAGRVQERFTAARAVAERRTARNSLRSLETLATELGLKVNTETPYGSATR
ncbi:serine/threonine-protein kinase [Tahibacter amnicola]|uniref:Protein kinase n=1 Tax=Tahibacter amnicola TaxID=2976241 RepID=A0ABY6BC47_9GAMM|nr:serine/threonine-protein kinase [Tahibacter amnicola]UXI66206.1 protein kinase [Tahibacter amnicola]